MTEEETKKAVSVAVERVRGLTDFRHELEVTRDEFAALISNWMDPDTFRELAITAYMQNADLWKANPLSVVNALRKSAQLRLRPDGEEAAIIVWDGVAQLQPMFKGVVRTLLRTRTVLKIEARVVRTGDEFEYWYGLRPDLRHTPAEAAKRGEVEYAYAIVWLSSGQIQFEVMERETLDKIRRTSKAPNSPAWKNWPEEMQRKAVVRRLSKYLEMDASQAAVLRYDDAMDAGTPIDPRDLIPEVDYRTIDERAEAATRETVDSLREGMERMEAKNGAAEKYPIAGKKVAFGTHKYLTWGELYAKLPGYVKHYVLEDPKCVWIEESVKADVREWVDSLDDGPVEEEKHDPKEIKALAARAKDAARKLHEVGFLSDDEWADSTSEIDLMLAEGGGFFALSDLVDELERKIEADSGETPPPDLFESEGS